MAVCKAAPHSAGVPVQVTLQAWQEPSGEQIAFAPHWLSAVHATQVREPLQIGVVPLQPELSQQAPERQEPPQQTMPPVQSPLTEQAVQTLSAQTGVGLLQKPHARRPPQVSRIRPQSLPSATHVVGVQPQTFGAPPPPQVLGEVHAPQSTTSPQLLVTLPQLFGPQGSTGVQPQTPGEPGLPPPQVSGAVQPSQGAPLTPQAALLVPCSQVEPAQQPLPPHGVEHVPFPWQVAQAAQPGPQTSPQPSGPQVLPEQAGWQMHCCPSHSS